MTWYINRGEDLQRDQRIQFPFYRILRHDFRTSELIFEDELSECSLDKPAAYPKDGVTTTNCVLKADLSEVGRSLFHEKVGINGEKYVEVHYDLIVEMKSALMRFSLEFNGKEVGSVEADYK